MNRQAARRKFHYIYKITRDNGQFYIGMHSTDNLEDGYFGSGKIITASIKKHGKEKHTKEILEFLPSREALKLREKELVTEELLDDKLCMNLKLGGEGGFEHLNTPAMRQQKIDASIKGGAATKKRLLEDADLAARWTRETSERMKAAHAAGKIKYNTFTGRKHSEETKQKIREARRARLKNSMPP